jgi:hypothetical protein
MSRFHQIATVRFEQTVIPLSSPPSRWRPRSRMIPASGSPATHATRSATSLPSSDRSASVLPPEPRKGTSSSSSRCLRATCPRSKPRDGPASSSEPRPGERVDPRHRGARHLVLRKTDLADGAGGHRATPGGGAETLHGLRGLAVLPRPAAANLGQRPRPSLPPAGHDRGATGVLKEAIRRLCNALGWTPRSPRRARRLTPPGHAGPEVPWRDSGIPYAVAHTALCGYFQRPRGARQLRALRRRRPQREHVGPEGGEAGPRRF